MKYDWRNEEWQNAIDDQVSVDEEIAAAERQMKKRSPPPPKPDKLPGPLWKLSQRFSSRNSSRNSHRDSHRSVGGDGDVGATSACATHSGGALATLDDSNESLRHDECAMSARRGFAHCSCQCAPCGCSPR